MTVTTAPPAPTTTGATHWTGAPADGPGPWLDRARRIADQVAADAADHDRDGSFVSEGFALLREHEMMSMLVPSELGGGGASHAEACAVLAELAIGCPATSVAFSMHSHLVAAQVWRHHRGMPAPVLERVAAQQLCLISTGASDWLDSSGSTVAVEGGYRVSARKQPASGCPAGDILVTSIRWDDAPDGPKVVHCAVPFSADGVSIEETWDSLGMRGTGSHTVVLDDVFVPEAAVPLVRPAGPWHPIFATVLGAAMPLIMASYVGVAEAATSAAVDTARHRGDARDREQIVGRMFASLTAAQDHVAAMIASSSNLTFDNTDEHADLTLRRKSSAATACIDTVESALEVAGGAGFARNSPIERLFRDVQGCRFHPLPEHQQQMFSGRRALA